MRNRAGYCATKGGVIAFTRAIAADHAHQGIRANAICPGTVATEWIGKILADAPDPTAAESRDRSVLDHREKTTLGHARRARLHKALIDSERAVYEARNGALNNAELLGALLQEPFFQWMRPFSQLIAAMDEAMFGDEPVTAAGARDYVIQAHALVTEPASPRVATVPVTTGSSANRTRRGGVPG